MFGMDRKQLIAAVVLICAIVFGTGYKTAEIRQKNNQKPVVTVNEPVKSEKAKPKSIMVHVCGAVRKSGVYTLDEGSRIIDAVYKAQPTSEADLNSLNLAELISDGQQIVVLRTGEVSAGILSDTAQPRISGAAGVSVKSGKININTADIDTLDQLPGIGPATAQKIIDYRNDQGRFKSAADLMQVSGIGEKKYAKIKDKITI